MGMKSGIRIPFIPIIYSKTKQNFRNILKYKSKYQALIEYARKCGAMKRLRRAFRAEGVIPP